MRTQTPYQNYLTIYENKINFLKKSKDRELTIFLVDDNKVYLKLLEQELSKNPKYEIYSFTSGEECLDKLYLAPDIAIVDYHLDELNTHAANGDVILEKIRAVSPHTEVIIISGDDKVQLVNDLMDMGAKEFIHKEKEHEFSKIKKMLRETVLINDEKVAWEILAVVFIFILLFIAAAFYLTGGSNIFSIY